MTVRRNPLKIDPTRTRTQRVALQRDFNRRFNALKREVTKLLVTDDAFGLRQPTINVHEFASTQFDIDNGPITERLRKIQESILKEDLISIENQPHITVRYGLHSPTPEQIGWISSQYQQVRVRLGNVSIFQLQDQDVVKIDVKSEDLESMHNHLGIIPNTKTHHVYSPHLTIAFVKSGKGQRYVGLSGLAGTELVFDTVTFSTKDDKRTNIKLGQGLTTNMIWQFLTRDQQLTEFTNWLKSQVAITVLAKAQTLGQLDSDNWLKEHIDRVYKKGMARAFDAVRKQQVSGLTLDFFNGTREQFLLQSFNRPVSVERVKLLASRAFNELNGVTEGMATQMQRTLVDGFISGKGPRELARDLNRDVEGLGRKRSERITQTEVIRAHNEGQLDAMEDLGVTSIGVATEWTVSGLGTTAKGNPSPCKLCAPLEGMVLTTKEAHGMLPRHPNCRCSWVPANVGEEPTTKRKDNKSKITKAIQQSLKAERPKKTKSQQRKLSRWLGSDRKIAKKRPESII